MPAFDCGHAPPHKSGMRMIPILEEILRHHGGRQEAMAKRLKVTQPTVSRWLQGAEPKINNRDLIISEAAKLGIVKSSYAEETSVPVVGYVGAGGEVLYDQGQGPFGEAKIPPHRTPTTVAVVVRGDSMAPQLEEGWTIYYDKRHAKPPESLFGKLCVIGLTDGRVLIKKLLPGGSSGLYVLYSINAAPLLDQAVEWVAPVSWIAPI